MDCLPPRPRQGVDDYADLVPEDLRDRMIALSEPRKLAVALVLYFRMSEDPACRPTIHEIADALALSVGGVRPPLHALIGAGVVQRMVRHLADSFDDEKVFYRLEPGSVRLITALFDVAYPAGPPRFDPPV